MPASHSTQGPLHPLAAETLDPGLSQAEALARLQAEGPNALPEAASLCWLALLREVVTEPMFLLLVACGSIYLVLGDVQEALMLLGFVLIIMGITLVQQHRTHRALTALRDLSSPRARVRRDGQVTHVAGRDLVRGDTVLLAEGERVPADLLLSAVANLSVDESLLTGEAMPVRKQLPGESDGTLEPELTQAWAGTLVTQGTAEGQVVATGSRSALGRIGQSLAGLGLERTPIQRETDRIVKRVALLGMGIAVVLAVLDWHLRGHAIQGVLVGLTLAMAILPEELPVMLTLFLGLGAWRLAKDRVLARSVPAVERLGATTVLCVDKTGTLTLNRMALRRLHTLHDVFDTRAQAGQPLPEPWHALLEYAVLASHRQAFDPMEAALDQAGHALLAGTEHLHADWTLVEDYPLSSGLLAMSRVWQSPDQSTLLVAAKGSPEAIVDLCHLGAEEAARIAHHVAAMASEGLRVLGVANATQDGVPLPGHQHDFDFVFLGLVAFEDPVRAEVPQAIAECQGAGIRVVMITGDHPATARAIALQAGLISASSQSGELVSGTELDRLGDEALQARLATASVFCRVQPEQKLRLVQALQARGDVVAMTGDGVNDAPALKAADIGVAMGARGTDVAREAAALVLLDDDFTSLVTAVRHGRRVFANLRKAIAFVVAVHVPIVGLSVLPVLMGWPVLLMPVHILSLQLVIDPACAFVFEAEPMADDTMRRPPRSTRAQLFDRLTVVCGVWQGGGLLVMLLGVFAGVQALGQSADMARGLTFLVLVLSNLALIQVNRTGDQRSWPGSAHGSRALSWVTLVTVFGLALSLSVPSWARLFAFERPTPALATAALGLVLLSYLWFELVKRVLGSRSHTTFRINPSSA